MTDVNTMVERLEKRAAKLNSLYNAMNATKKGDPDGNMLAEAAALIRSLAAERDQLRERLEFLQGDGWDE